MKTTNLYKYFLNCFILSIPILIWNILLTDKLPKTSKSELEMQNISQLLIYGENIVRVMVFVLMVFMPIQISKTIQKQGLALYLFGTLLYFASWLVLIFYPDSLWSKGTLGVLSPAYTPLLWLIGIGLIGDRFYCKLPYKRWLFISASILFLVFTTFILTKYIFKYYNQLETIKVVIQILAVVFGSLAALMSITIFLRLHWPSPFLWIVKLFASALSPILLLTGLLTLIVGITTGSVFITLIGMYDVLIFSIHIYGITRPLASSGSFESAFGLNWEEQISDRKKYFLPRRVIKKLPSVPIPRIAQDISFATIPGSNRKLLCDVWQPNETVTPSGLAFIYLHGSAWYMLDKDMGTRPFFTHLAAQGHVIMDVAYRLSPETDMMGMVNDVKLAIVWMKANANIYKVNPDAIVVGGGSAGAHLALMAAYTATNPQFTPAELVGKDSSVCGVVSLYGPTDLKAMYFHTNQQITTRSKPGSTKKAVLTQLPEWLTKRMGDAYYRLKFDKGFVKAGTFAPLLGGHPDECPEQYALYSPITHVHVNCPATLLIHGEHDVMAPVATTRILYKLLVGGKVPTVLHILPQTDHAFDLILPKISPSAHSAIYDVERFLALQIKNVEKARGDGSREFVNNSSFQSTKFFITTS